MYFVDKTSFLRLPLFNSLALKMYIRSFYLLFSCGIKSLHITHGGNHHQIEYQCRSPPNLWVKIHISSGTQRALNVGAFDVWRVFGESRYRCMRTRWMEEKKKKWTEKYLLYKFLNTSTLFTWQQQRTIDKNFSHVFSKEQSTTYNEKIQDFSRVVFALGKIPNKFVTPPVLEVNALKFGCVF